MTKQIKAIPLAFAALAILAFGGMVLAENTDPLNDNSQFAWAENAGWLNAEPANCGNCGLTITDTKLTGYLWSENVGWVNMSCENSGTCAGPAGNWGVTNNGLGSLAGYAWSENRGWINFSCKTNVACAGPAGNWGVSVNPATGVLSGQAWGENLGWVSLSDSSPVAYRVQTGWPNTDGDGYTDSVEAGVPLCANAANDDSFETTPDTAVNDGCPAVVAPEAGSACANAVDNDGDGAVNDGCPLVGVHSEATFKIGTGAADPCGFDGWPSNVFDGGLSGNKLDVQDIVSFVTPRRLDKNPGETDFSSRWDLTPGRGIFSKFINIVDITTLLQGGANSPAFPPMFSGLRAFGKPCPFAP